jgi:TRAP-type C4-dicarboxylate transport system permease small subunit
MKRSIRAVTEKIFEWLSLAAGLLILGSCSYLGFAKSGPVIGVGVLLMSAIFAAALVAFVFMITRTSADVRAIREQLDTRKTDAKPDAETEG